MCVGQRGGRGGGRGVGRMGAAAAAAVMYEELRVPVSSQSIQSKYLCYLMEICTPK